MTIVTSNLIQTPKVVTIDQNRWSRSVKFTGHDLLEWVVTIDQNTQTRITSENNEAVNAVNLASMSATVRKALIQFDDTGRLVRLPNKLSVQQMTMWALWTQFAANRKYTEKEINAIVNGFHTFGDQATLRRELVNMKLLGRKSDCSEYWKEPHRPVMKCRISFALGVLV